MHILWLHHQTSDNQVMKTLSNYIQQPQLYSGHDWESHYESRAS